MPLLIFFAAYNATVTRNAFQWAGQQPTLEIWTSIWYMVHWAHPTWVYPPIGISIVSVVFFSDLNFHNVAGASKSHATLLGLESISLHFVSVECVCQVCINLCSQDTKGVRTSVVVPADEADARVTFGETHEALVSAVERAARKSSSTVLRLAAAGCRLGARSAAVTATFLTCLGLSHLCVIRVVVAVVTETRRRFLRRLADFPAFSRYIPRPARRIVT